MKRFKFFQKNEPTNLDGPTIYPNAHIRSRDLVELHRREIEERVRIRNEERMIQFGINRDVPYWYTPDTQTKINPKLWTRIIMWFQSMKLKWYRLEKEDRINIRIAIPLYGALLVFIIKMMWDIFSHI